MNAQKLQKWPTSAKMASRQKWTKIVKIGQNDQKWTKWQKIDKWTKNGQIFCLRNIWMYLFFVSERTP